MTIPTSSNYPTSFDDDSNLYHVYDSLRVTLADDYNPGDTSITVTGDANVMARFPAAGFVTLTDQCNDIDDRALTFYYSSKTDYTFDGLTLISGFTDVSKPRDFTHVTLNVLAVHHNSLKDALIAIESFLGIKGTVDTMPLGSTLEGRLNFLRRLVFTPRAWFKVVGPRVGLVPLTVTFEDQSFRLGSGPATITWDFGDQTASTVSTISVISTVPVDAVNVLVEDIDAGTITKTYSTPGIYPVQMTVENEYGSDTVIFEDLINARIEAPDEAKIVYDGKINQLVDGTSIRSPVDTFIDITIPGGIDLSTGRTYGGEVVDGSNSPIDPITTYTWSLSDDLTHANQTTARALYSIGGKYDLKLRVDTLYGAYRITTFEEAIDIVENKSLWLWTFAGDSHPAGQYGILDYLKLTGSIKANEFGLISETFKTGNTSLLISRNDAFLESADWQAVDDPLSGYNTIADAKREFRRNVAFTPRGTTTSGSLGTCMMYYATGGAQDTSLLDQSIQITEYNGFTDVYDTSHPGIARPWNWVFLGSLSASYFIMGQDPNSLPMSNPSYQTKSAYDLDSCTLTESLLTLDNYKNGAQELMQHKSIYQLSTGKPQNGWFAVYRSTWKNNTGYFVRNDGVGSFFRIKNFYKTESVVGLEFANIKKLPDMEGPTKLEGQLLALTNGIFFFNNTGSISAYNDTTGTWETGGPSADSAAFYSIQDRNVQGYSSGSNTLLACSNNDYVAYLSYDYSENSFVKFNAQDLTFRLLQSRPTGSQFLMGTY